MYTIEDPAQHFRAGVWAVATSSSLAGANPIAAAVAIDALIAETLARLAIQLAAVGLPNTARSIVTLGGPASFRNNLELDLETIQAQGLP